MRARAVLVAVTTALLLTACASIPTSGQVNRVADDNDSAGSTARFRPAPPIPGAAPDVVVRGFLDAMLAYPATSRVAAQFLTQDAADGWNPAASTLVYSSPVLGGPVPDGSRNRVRLDVTQRAFLDDQGHHEVRSGGRTVTWDLTLVDGEWRIANPPDGVLVTEDWFSDYVRPFTLFFVDPDREVVIPDPVHRVVGDQLPTTLMTALAAGPQRAIAADVQTRVPGVDGLRPTVPIDANGVADVAFTTAVDDRVRRDMSAQVIWTLKQVLGVKSVRLRVNGDVVSFGAGSTQAVDLWSGFDPSRTARRIGVVQRGGAATIDGKSVNALRPVENIRAVALGTRVAMLTGDRLVVGRRDGTAMFEIRGRDLLAPVVDSDDTVWAVESSGRVRVRDLDERTIGRLPGVESFAVSPDAARYAAVLDGRLVVGAVLRRAGRAEALGDPVPVTTRAGRAVEVAWLDSTSLAHISGADPAAFITRIDSSSTVPVGQGPAPEGATTGRLVDLAVAGAGTPSVYVLDADQRVWLLDGEVWAPTAGLDVTSIS